MHRQTSIAKSGDDVGPVKNPEITGVDGFGGAVLVAHNPNLVFAIFSAGGGADLDGPDVREDELLFCLFAHDGSAPSLSGKLGALCPRGLVRFLQMGCLADLLHSAAVEREAQMVS